MRDLYFFVVKIVGGKGVCILGYAKFFVPGMQLDRSRKTGGNAFAYPFAYPKSGVCMFFFCLQRWPDTSTYKQEVLDLCRPKILLSFYRGT